MTGDLDSDVNTLEREKGKVQEGSEDETNISGREAGRRAGKDNVRGAGEASTPASRKGEEMTGVNQGPRLVCGSWQIEVHKNKGGCQY